MVMAPPAALLAVVSPAVTDTAPPAAVLPLPPVAALLPPLPAVARPVSKVNQPLSPLLDVPLKKDNAPDTPLSPASKLIPYVEEMFSP